MIDSVYMHVSFYTGDEANIVIDQYDFTPTSHVLSIRFNLTTGEEGLYQGTFNGLEREGM